MHTFGSIRYDELSPLYLINCPLIPWNINTISRSNNASDTSTLAKNVKINVWTNKIKTIANDNSQFSNSANCFIKIVLGGNASFETLITVEALDEEGTFGMNRFAASSDDCLLFSIWINFVNHDMKMLVQEAKNWRNRIK